MNITQRDRELGTAYAMRPSASRTELTEVGRGTPMGELLRRYWHPVGLAADATDTPRKVRALGEDLILFRDRHGRAGLLHARCCHRGTTLYYGKVEEDGIRCCYHGWKFDTEGHCLEQPCEPDGGQFRDKVRQPWYPVAGTLRADLRLYGTGGEKAGAAALRMPGEDGRRRVRRSRRHLDRRRRAGRHPLQLAAAFRERGRSLPRAGAARLVQRAAIHQHDGLDAGGGVRDVAARRHGALDPQAGRRQGLLSGDRSRAPYAARRAESARRAIRPRRVDRLDAADRRHLVPHLRRRPGQEARRYRADALEVQRQVLVGHDRAGAPAIPRRLRGAGRPGRDDAAFGGAFRPERPRHPDDPADAERSARGGGRRPRSDRRLASIEARRRSNSKRGISFARRETARPFQENSQGETMVDLAPQAAAPARAPQPGRPPAAITCWRC